MLKTRLSIRVVKWHAQFTRVV